MGAPRFRKKCRSDPVARIGMIQRATAVFVAIAAISINAAAANESPQPPVLGSAKNLVINAAVTRKRLPIAGGAPASGTELVLRNIRFDAHPGTQFNVILERSDDPTKRARVGTLSFYVPTNTRITTSRTFDVTDELRQLAVSKAGLNAVNVVFEATTGRGGTNAKSTFDPQSKLTVGEVELRVKAK
jgi:hypothetical protein